MHEKYQRTTYSESSYPQKLKIFPAMPELLYFKGCLPDNSKKTVAIVGARKCSSYGAAVAERFAQILAENQVQVISGLAIGIDSFAHEGCLKGRGSTFAVMGCGIERIYPRSNAGLYRRIIKSGGGIISEFEPDSPPYAFHFPIRNRIISALSDAVIVIEAERKSGSLITASCALEQGIQVYAVPGRIGDRLCEGTNDLIWQGAIPALSAEQILEDLGLGGGNPKSKKEELSPACNNGQYSPKELKILNLLSASPVSMDHLCQVSKMSVSEISSALFSLELDGTVFNPFPGLYARTYR